MTKTSETCDAEELRELVADLRERGEEKEKNGEHYSTVGHGLGLLTAADELEWVLDDE